MSAEQIDAARHSLAEIGAYCYERGWSLGTSSNYSVVTQRQPLRLLITASGRSKHRLGAGDFVLIDEHAHAAPGGDPAARPSAEAMLHVVAAQHGAGAVLHTHSVWGTLLSDMHYGAGGIAIEGYEMLKALHGIQTHEHQFWLEIFDNTQEIAALARRVAGRLADPARPLRHGLLIRRHGLYAWGRDIDEARRHVEALEFLLEVIGRRAHIKSDRFDD